MFSPSASPPSLSSSHGFVLVAFVVVSSEDVFEAAVEGVLVEEAQAEYRDCGLDCNKKPSRLVVTESSLFIASEGGTSASYVDATDGVVILLSAIFVGGGTRLTRYQTGDHCCAWCLLNEHIAYLGVCYLYHHEDATFVLVSLSSPSIL